MKDFRFSLTLTALLSVIFLGGCDDTPAPGDDNGTSVMRFHATDTPGKRSATTNESFLRAGNTFKVWGSYKSQTNATFKPTEIFDGTDVTYSTEGNWTYTDPRYWHSGFRYDFRAIHPSGIAESVTYTIGESSNDTPTFALTNYDVLQGFDILYAAPSPIDAVSGPMPAVALHFRHLLSRVIFIGRSDEQHLGTGRRIIIDSAKLYGLHTTGTWNGHTTADNSIGEWRSTGQLHNGETTPYRATSVELHTDGTFIFTGKDTQFFLPQSLASAVLEITYHYNYSDSTRPLQYTGTVRLSELSANWEAGKSYRYPFTISSHIFFEKPTVEEWKQAPINSSDFNVDIEDTDL